MKGQDNALMDDAHCRQSAEVNMEHDYQQSIDSFHKKELALKNLMVKVSAWFIKVY